MNKISVGIGYRACPYRKMRKINIHQTGFIHWKPERMIKAMDIRLLSFMRRRSIKRGVEEIVNSDAFGYKS